MKVKFGIKKWAAWTPGAQTQDEWKAWAAGQRELGSEGVPDAKAIPPMLRRRLERIGRAALQVASDCLGETRDIPLIFASRNGETPRSVRLLEQLAAGEALSPTDFGLSVHNAAGGLFTIARQERTDCSAMAAGIETLPHALLEAVLHLQEHAAVLLVISDEILPEANLPYADEQQQPFACALLLEAAQDSALPLQLQLTAHDGSEVPAYDMNWTLQMLRWLCSDADHVQLTAATRRWRLERCDACA